MDINRTGGTTFYVSLLPEDFQNKCQLQEAHESSQVRTIVKKFLKKYLHIHTYIDVKWTFHMFTNPTIRVQCSFFEALSSFEGDTSDFKQIYVQCALKCVGMYIVQWENYSLQQCLHSAVPLHCLRFLMQLGALNSFAVQGCLLTAGYECSQFYLYIPSSHFNPHHFLSTQAFSSTLPTLPSLYPWWG